MEQKVYPVDVISMCSASGEIRPLRLRLEDEEHQLFRIDIEEILSTKDIQYDGMPVYNVKSQRIIASQGFRYDFII